MQKKKNFEFVNKPGKWLMYKLRKEKENDFHTSAGKYLLTDNVAIQKKNPFIRVLL